MVQEELDPSLNQLTEQVIGALIAVHEELGPGLPEHIYEKAVCVEFRNRDIPFECQVVVPVNYRGAPIGEMRLDLIVAGKLVVELKSVDSLVPLHKAQVISYLRVTRMQLGLLVNFNSVV